MDNLNLALLSGGYYECTPSWNSEPYGKDNCYKLYYLTNGSGKLYARGKWYHLHAGNCYFINGFMLDKYSCDEFMNVYWLHFIPESHLLSMILNNLEPVFCWENGDPLIAGMKFATIPTLFDNPDLPQNKPSGTVSLSMDCYIHSLLLLLISDITNNHNETINLISNGIYLKLKPAIDYINSHYTESLKIEEIAMQAFMNPVYFERIFKKCFIMTPLCYIKMIRINEGCRLLTKTELSVREIAEQLGFCNQFYFSKVFKNHFHKTPLEYRRTILSP